MSHSEGLRIRVIKAVVEDERFTNGLTRARADSRRQLANFETIMMVARTPTSRTRTQYSIRSRRRCAV